MSKSRLSNYDRGLFQIFLVFVTGFVSLVYLSGAFGTYRPNEFGDNSGGLGIVAVLAAALAFALPFWALLLNLLMYLSKIGQRWFYVTIWVLCLLPPLVTVIAILTRW